MSASDLSGREFLERRAYGAGLAGMAAGLPASTILAESAEAAHRRSHMPSRGNMKIDHFVILMMENRSFDHYFGWNPDADGMQHQTVRAPDGRMVPTRHFSTLGTGGVQYKGCGHEDPGHSWDSGRAQLRGGFLADGSGNDELALTNYDKGELGFIHEAARKYTMYDRTSARCSPRPGRTATTSGRRSLAAARTTLRRSRPAATSGSRSSTAPSATA